MQDTSTPVQSAPALSPLTRGKLLGHEPGRLVLGLPGTEYRLHLVTDRQVEPDAVGFVRGRITARARRVDVVKTGGRFIEPVYGRPRRLQGVVTSVDAAAGTITVQGPCPFVCTLTARQNPQDFEPGQLVGFDMESGAKFEPAATERG